MSVVIFKITCKNGHEFRSPNPHGGYGEFIVRGEISPEPGLLNTVGDEVFDEVDQLLTEIGAYEGKGDMDASDLLHAIFGVACDNAPDGTQLKTSRFEACPICGNRKVKSMEPVYPIQLYDGALFQVTHNEWSKLSKSEKITRLKKALENAEPVTNFY